MFDIVGRGVWYGQAGTILGEAACKAPTDTVHTTQRRGPEAGLRMWSRMLKFIEASQPVSNRASKLPEGPLLGRGCYGVGSLKC